MLYDPAMIACRIEDEDKFSRDTVIKVLSKIHIHVDLRSKIFPYWNKSDLTLNVSVQQHCQQFPQAASL